MELAYALPVAASLAWGGWLVAGGHASLGAVTAVTLYCVQIVDPVDRLLSWLDEVQVGATALARILGVDAGARRPGRRPTRRLATSTSSAPTCASPTATGRDVLHGIDVDLVPGERLAVVGPSGAGKSTLGRLLAGIHPPRTGRVTVGGVPLVDLPLDDLRGHVVLVTQEHHVFVGTLADNLRLARPDADAPPPARRAGGGRRAGLGGGAAAGPATPVGSGGHPVTPAQAQQLALARLVLADPHTLVLDEATSLLDPRAARHLERSLGAVLDGRTVVAIAHRLHTAHDAHRVAVVDGGLITELGSHDELMASGGAYAELWHSWRADPTAPVR